MPFEILDFDKYIYIYIYIYIYNISRLKIFNLKTNLSRHE